MRWLGYCIRKRKDLLNRLPTKLQEYFLQSAKAATSSSSQVRTIQASSALVFGCAIFDTFIADTLTLLLLRFPETMGRDSKVPFEMLLHSTSREEVIAQVIQRRVRELGFESLANQLEFLNRHFKAGIALSKVTIDSLRRTFELRNKLVHDQSSHDLKIGRRGQLVLKSRPRRVRAREIMEISGSAFDEFLTAMKHIYRQVATNVLKAGDVISAVDAGLVTPDAVSNPELTASR